MEEAGCTDSGLAAMHSYAQLLSELVVWERECVARPAGEVEWAAVRRPILAVGGGGENRTRVRKPSAPRSTCLYRL